MVRGPTESIFFPYATLFRSRVGGKYSNEWHVQHFKQPSSVVPESIMPNYPWLLENTLAYADVGDRMRALKKVGVPYSETEAEYKANVEEFGADVAKMLDIQRAQENLLEQAQTGNYDGDRTRITEVEALIAYMQILGTMVDFSKYDEGYFIEYR